MRWLTIIALVGMGWTTSCAIKEREMKMEKAKENMPSAFLPDPIDDEWSRWLVGEWEGGGDSDAGKGKGWSKIEMGLNGQFLIIKGEGEITEIAPEQKRYLKETLHASDEEIKRFQSSTYKSLEIRTIDPKTGETVGYLFDSLRCIAVGRGKREGNKETMTWKWSVSGQGSGVRITEKVNNDKAVVIERSTLPNGSIMEEKGEMIRRKTAAEK